MPAWPWPATLPGLARLAALALVAIAAGCKLDDRVLSGEDLGGGSGGSAGSGGAGGSGGAACIDTGSTACESCLYESCCAQTQACEAGSDCVRYLECAEGCSGGDGCLSACSRDYPTGFGDAIALAVCGQTACSASCSEDEPDALATCNPRGRGACQNAGDCDALGAGALDDLDVSACPTCAQPGDVACGGCLAQSTGLSPECSGCVSDWLSCAVLYCEAACRDDVATELCDACLADSGCALGLGACAFTD